MKKLIITGALMVIVLVIGITPAKDIDLGSLNQAHTKHAVYSENITIEGINGQSYVDVTTTNGSITINGNIDGQSTVKLTAQNGSIIIMGNIVGSSSVTLLASGIITINGMVATNGAVATTSAVAATSAVAGNPTIVRYKATSINIHGGTQGNAVVETVKTVKPASISNN